MARARRMPKVVKESATVTLAASTGRIAIVSDTHSAPHENALKVLRAARPDAILHGGDIGDLAVLDDLRAIAPTFAVRGNIDGHVMPDELTIDVRSRDGEEGEEDGESLFRIFLVHMAVYGPKLRSDVARRARVEGAAMVVCGHSHVPFIGKDQGLTVFNPGSIGPRRFQLPIVFGLVDVSPGSVKLQHVSCETGQRWLP